MFDHITFNSFFNMFDHITLNSCCFFQLNSIFKLTALYIQTVTETSASSASWFCIVSVVLFRIVVDEEFVFECLNDCWIIYSESE